MHRVVLFGGTAEGRSLCAYCAANGIAAVYCVATEDGARAVASLPGIAIRIGRLDAVEMTALLRQEQPLFVVDATHPYAVAASLNISFACNEAGLRLVRVARTETKAPGCTYLSDADELLAFLAQTPGNIFATTGVSYAAVFARLVDFQTRVWLRVLPSLDSLRICYENGYRSDRLICMQGPFSEDLNRAMFASAEARILVTKDGGAAGGFPEKLAAANNLGMLTAVIKRPQEDGENLQCVIKILKELRG